MLNSNTKAKLGMTISTKCNYCIFFIRKETYSNIFGSHMTNTYPTKIIRVSGSFGIYNNLSTDINNIVGTDLTVSLNEAPTTGSNDNNK